MSFSSPPHSGEGSGEGSGLCFPRQRQIERAALPEFAFEPHLAAVPLRDALDDRQPQPPGRMLRVVARRRRGKIFRRSAAGRPARCRSRCPSPRRRPHRPQVGADLHRPAGAVETDRILDQVAERALQQRGIGRDGGQGFRDPDLDLDPARRRFRFQFLRDLRHDGRQFHRRQADFRAALDAAPDPGDP